MSDVLTDAPSISSWAALAVLVGLIAVSATAGRERPQKPQTARATEHLLDSLGWLPQVGLLLALVPGTVALLSGGSWPTALWWWMLGLCALMVCSLIAGSLVGLARRWPSWRHEIQPHERRAVMAVIALTSASALAVPAALVALTALGVQTMAAVALSLALAYGLWHVAYAITRTAPSLSQT